MQPLVLPQLPGFTFRYFVGPQDFDALSQVQTACLVEDLIDETATVEEVANDFNYASDFDPLQDVVLAEAQGQVVAYARLTSNCNDEGQWIYWQTGFVLPQWRRRGLGRALLNFTEARSSVLARPRNPAAPHLLRGYGEDTALGKIALFQNAGYSVARYFLFMIHRDLQNLPSIRLPAGFEFRPALPEQDRDIWDAKEEAFRDHWGHTTRTDADYQHWLHSPFHQPAIWPVIWDTARNTVAAMSLNCIVPEDNARFGFLRGNVNHLGVRRPYRGQGLGRAVLLKSLEMFRDQGLTEAVLGVDSENPSGALGLYQRTGFTILNQDALFEKPVEL